MKTRRSRIVSIFSSNYFIVLIFFLISILSGIFLIKGGFVGRADDLPFHWQRIYELRNSIIHGNWFPHVALNEFGQSGNAVMTMYPFMSLFPITLLSFVIKDFVLLVYLTFIFRNFVALMVAYYSCYHFQKNKSISFLFASSYVLSSMMLAYCFQNMDMGVSASLLFFPLAIFGLFELLNNGNWIELSTGMSLIIFCHVLNTLIIVITLLLIAILNWSKLNKKKLIALVKAVSLTILTTGVFWVPFVVLSITNKISLPPSTWNLGGTDFNTLINPALSNQIVKTINISALLGIIIGIINFKHLRPFTKQAFWLSISFMLICSDFFPWSLLNLTIIKNVLQFSWRLYTIPQILLCYVFAESVISLCKTSQRRNTLLVIITLGLILVQGEGQEEILNQNKYSPELTSISEIDSLAPFRINNSKEFKKVVTNPTAMQDYLPKSSLSQYSSISKQQGLYDIDKTINFSLMGNGKYSFKTRRKDIQELNLPVVHYNSLQYIVKMDGKPIPFHSNKTSRLTINYVKKGYHTIQVVVKNSWYHIFSYILTIIGLMLYVLLGTKYFIVNRKRKRS